MDPLYATMRNMVRERWRECRNPFPLTMVIAPDVNEALKEAAATHAPIPGDTTHVFWGKTDIRVDDTLPPGEMYLEPDRCQG